MKFTLGADPELCLTYRGNVISAGNFVGNNAQQTDFGADGNGITFELRPHYSYEPIGVVNNIREILLNAVTKDAELLRFNWHAGSFVATYPIGGHIHFGMSDTTKRDILVRCCDQYLASVVCLIEKLDEAKKRRSSSYGKASDMRNQSHGIEYRTLSSWLTSPVIAIAVLSLAKVVAHETLNKNSNLPNHINTTYIDEMKVSSLYEKFPAIWADIIKMELYPEYKPYIDVLHYLITNKKCWYPQEDFKSAWGLVDMSKLQDRMRLKMENVWNRCILKHAPKNKEVMA